MGIILTVINFLGFMMIGPFTPFTLFIGIPVGLAAVIYWLWKAINSAGPRRTRVYAALLVSANIYILYITLNFL